MADPKISALFHLAPKEAVEYLQGRKQLAKTFSWQDLWQGEHAHQFTVSRLARLDILESLRDGITRSAQGDLSRRDWMKDARALLEKEGWWGTKEVLEPSPSGRGQGEGSGTLLTTKFDPARLKLIYDTNARMAYAAGQWQRITRNKSTHPYIRYITKRDEKVRHSHRAWHNLVLPVDHPFWKTHFPPNGWRCRCGVVSMSQKEFDAGLSPTGEKLNTDAPVIEYRDWVNKRTGAVERVPVGIDPGFAYNPGMAAARQANLAGVEAAKLAQASPAMAAAYNATMSQAFARQSMSVSDRKIEVVLGAVIGADAIFGKTGLDLTGHIHTADNYAVRHTMKSHGDAPIEIGRGQIAVTLADFDMIGQIVSSPDDVFADGKNKIGRDVVVFVKVIDGTGYRYVGEIRKKGKRVAMDSMRKKKGAWGS